MGRKRKEQKLPVKRDYGEDDETFQEAMGRLRRVPDKDETGVFQAVAPASRSRRDRHRLADAPSLDLHGMNADRALRELDGFVQRSRAGGSRHIRVITGKGQRSVGGKPVLKSAVARWLRGQGDRVEKWQLAPPRLGGQGAYILTLRPRRSR